MRREGVYWEESDGNGGTGNEKERETKAKKIVLCFSAALALVSADGYDSRSPSGFRGSESRISQSRASFGGGSFAGGNAGPAVPILADDRQAPDASGAYSFNFETGDGVSRQEQGSPQGPSGAVSQSGGWSYTLPDGTPAVFRFVADENGFRVESDLLPTPPPLPPHAIEQIERARLEQAASASSNRGSFASQSAPQRQYNGPSASASQFAQASAPAPQFAQASAPAPQFAQASASASQFSQSSASASQFSQASAQGSLSASNQFGASSAPAPQFGRPSASRPSQRPAAPSAQYGTPQ
ncbi:pneumococcal serine-rich repeat protein-like [Palaemon carinicauda]|uniref:pneumococcal serine-rich repeat protein-like n=1 Tax=Palaemon carinicauda TaxID=392227 RepID=UPI0035B59CCC